jgi:hypothetical protein
MAARLLLPMANEEQLRVLLEGFEQWNEWREANPEARPDLRQADLHETDLQRTNLAHAILIDADLHQACLKEANLAGANLRRADLRGADFESANLHGATLAKTDLRDANLSGADVREADLRESRLSGARLDGADMKGAVLNKDGFRYVALHNDQLKAATTASSPAPPAAGPTIAPASRAAAPTPRESSIPAAHKRSPKLVLVAGAVLLVSGSLGFWMFRPASPDSPRLSPAVSQAVGNESGVNSVAIEGDTLVVRTAGRKVESAMYLGLLKTACQALAKMENEAELRAIRITNQGGDEGWVYDAPEQCGDILTKPAGLSSLSIAAHTKPIQR